MDKKEYKKKMLQIINAIEVDSREKKDLKSRVYWNIKDNLGVRLKKIRDFEEYKEKIKELENNFNSYREYSEEVHKYFNEDLNYHILLIKLIDPKDHILEGRILDIIFNNWSELVTYSRDESVEELAEKYTINYYHLSIRYKLFLLNYFRIYNNCHIKSIRKYFRQINHTRLMEYFYYACRTNKDVIVFDKKELHLSIYKLLLRTTTSYEIDVEKNDLNSFKRFLSYTPYDEYPDAVPIIHSIFKNIEERLDVKNTLDENLKIQLTENQLSRMHVKLIDEIFDEETSEQQINALFKGDFNYLHEDKLKLKKGVPTTTFRFLIDRLEEKKIFYIKNISSTFDKYEWLLKKGESLSTKEFQQAKDTNFQPRNYDFIEKLIIELLNCY